MKIKPPCRGCRNRSQTCHNLGECEKYTEYFKSREELSGMRKEAHDQEVYYEDKLKRIRKIHNGG